MSVLHINSKNGYILDAVAPREGVGVDSDSWSIKEAINRYPLYHFYNGSAADVTYAKPFDFIVISFATMEVDDIQLFLHGLHRLCHPGTRIMIDTYSPLWKRLRLWAQNFGLASPTAYNNWLTCADLITFLDLSEFQLITTRSYMLMPVYIPVVSWVCNTLLAPLVRALCLHHVSIARPVQEKQNAGHITVSVIISCRNERGNIERVVQECPSLGFHTELIFVEGGSTDGTLEEIKRVADVYKGMRDIRWFVQDGVGKGDAVRKGFAHAKGDVLMILDADLTTGANELPKFFHALITGKGEFINGSRLVYPMESQAMPFLNKGVNYLFGRLLSCILGQRIKDALCGTKVLWKRDYAGISAGRGFLEQDDLFGDFDLLLGAAKRTLKIIDLPVRYKDRTYGKTNIRRFWHGWLLLCMSLRALYIFKCRLR